MQDEATVPMHIECLNDAILEAINAIGGKKAVGAKLKPDRDPTDAGKWLSDCLNPLRNERLTPDQLAYIRKHARMVGCHILAAYELQEAGYAAPQPVEPECERAALQRTFIESVRTQQHMLERLASLGGE